MTDVSDLRAKLDAYHRERSVRKCGSTSWDEVCERHAIAIYGVAVEAIGSKRRAAALSEHDRKTITDRLSGARGIALKDAVKLRSRDAYYAIAGEFMRLGDELPESEVA